MSSTSEIAAATASRTNAFGLSRVTPLVAAAATLAYSALLIAPPTSRADETVLTAGTATSCPDVQVVFARATGEPPGAGRVGERQVGGCLRRPISGLLRFSAGHRGVNDASAFIENTAQACSQTKWCSAAFHREPQS
jgi:cutinase